MYCCKAAIPAENTTEAEMDAANQLGHALRWMHLLMEDVGLPFDGGPVPVTEDNSATHIIAHTLERLLATSATLHSRLSLFSPWSENESLSSVLSALPITKQITSPKR
jgi:hypothetical protein